MPPIENCAVEFLLSTVTTREGGIETAIDGLDWQHFHISLAIIGHDHVSIWTSHFWQTETLERESGKR